MTDRRARLERRISEIPVPPPPAGLAERIKRDIPERLPASTPESLTDLSPYRVWVRVAAILLVVVSSTFVAMQLLVRDFAKPSVQTAEVAEADMGRDVAIPPPPSVAMPSIQAQHSSVEKSVDASARPAVLQDAAAAPPARIRPESVEARAERRAVLSSPAEEYENKKRMKVQTVTASRTADFRQTDSVDQIATANVAKESRKNAKDDADSLRELGETRSLAGSMVGGAVPQPVAEPIIAVTAQAAPSVAPATPPSIARAQSSASARRSALSKLEVSSYYESSAGGFVDAEERAVSNFPLTVGTDSYATARASLRGGKLPSPPSLRVEEFVNSFDYGDPSPSNGDFSLTSEGSISTFRASPRYRLVRFGIHPRLGLGTRMATAEVHFNDEVVQHYRLLGYETRGHNGKGLDRPAPEEQVLPNRGVVALYEVRLQQNYQRRDTLATLKLSYRSANDEQVDISKDLRADEVEQTWLDARRSMQLASIAATFAEVLRGDEVSRGVDLAMLAERARFVASRYPGNPAVKELVTLIETAARLKKAEKVK